MSTYAHALAEQSAGAALAQLARALAGNVWYLDGGWRQLTDALGTVAEGGG